MRRVARHLAVFALLTLVWLVAAVYGRDFPAALLEADDVESTRLRDRHDHVLREALNDHAGRGAWRTLDAVGPWFPMAFVAIEDHRFFDHAGVDPLGIARAAAANVSAGAIVAGGSTLTQQVVKHVLPQPRSIAGKLQEAILALRLERVATKPEILEQYLNRVPFGHGAFGVEAAARLYFDRPARSLGLAQVALLAGIPRAPSRNNPFTDRARAIQRQRVVLDRMLALGVVDAETCAEARAEPLELADRARQLGAPHFTTWALTRLAVPPGPAPGGRKHAPTAASSPGSSPTSRGDVPTTLDPALQREAEAAVRASIRALRDRDVSQGAVVVLDNATGDVRAWVGSADFFDPDAGQVDMVVGLRQPGSTLKPFLYGLAFEGGITPATPVPDLPLFFPTANGDYRPRNYDRTHHGWVPARVALANSYNVPAVWLADRLGSGTFLGRLRAMGFDSLSAHADHYGLGLALGNGEVSLLELANAYRTLANDGIHRPIRWRRDAPVEPGVRLMPAAVARLVTDVIADPVARAPAFGRDGPLSLPFPAAVKTGTSTDFTDNWTAGYSTRLTVAAWVGNFDGRPMRGVSGVSGAGPLWNAVMRAAHADDPPAPFSREGLRGVDICGDTDCALRVRERVLAGSKRPAMDRQPPAADGLTVTFPDDGDEFTLSADVPRAHARLRLRADGTRPDERLVWILDGAPLGETSAPHALWWPLRPGEHRLQVASVDAPNRASAPIRFRVHPPPHPR